MNVDDLVEERIRAARVRIAAAKRRRAELSAARARGLKARHANKLRNLREADARAAAKGPTTGSEAGSPSSSHSARSAQLSEAELNDPNGEPNGPGRQRPSLTVVADPGVCTVCGYALDPIHLDAGETTHPTCDTALEAS